MPTEEFYRTLLDRLNDGVYFVDRDRRITYWNPAAERITGYAPAEVLGRTCFANILRHQDGDGGELCLAGCPLHDTLQDGRQREAETLYLRRKDGSRLPISITVAPVRDEKGAITGAVEIFGERSTRREVERRMSELQRRLETDRLTGVANRELMERTIRTRLFDLRSGGAPFGVGFIDVDHFKAVNDSHGHDVGDAALRAIATTLMHNVRPADLVARWGGEEFVGLFTEVDATGLHAVCYKLLLLVRGTGVPAPVEGLSLTVSIGATLATAEDELEGLVKRADALMYKAKRTGRDTVQTG